MTTVWNKILLFFLAGISILANSSAAAFVDNDYVIADRTIYLTFDDGPTPVITNKILDTLKDKGIKATFFVIGSKVENNNEIMKRIHNEGHSIGLHTFSHNIKKIYKDQESFINEMNKTEKIIYDMVGVKSKIIRFPTGSKGHLNQSLYDKLNSEHYKIFDWNARITDGVYPNKTPKVLYNEAIESSKKWETVFLLMHCAEKNKNTCKALPLIIDYFLANKYKFKVINNNTPEYFFKFRHNNFE